MGATSEAFLVTSANPIAIPKKAPYELIIVINDSANANAVFCSVSGDASTTPTGKAGSERIPPGGVPGVYFLDPSNVNGVSAIAASGNTTVMLKRVPFPDEAAFFEAISSYAAMAALIAALWFAATGTAVQLVGNYTEARADTVGPKTAATSFAVQDSNRTTRIEVTPTVLELTSEDRTDYIDVLNGGENHYTNSVLRQVLSDTELQLVNAEAIVQYNGSQVDPRHTLNSNSQIMNFPSAGGQISGTRKLIELPIANAAVVAAGDIVEFATSASVAVSSAAAGSTRHILGKAITGGTGNVGLTVFAQVLIEGVEVSSLIADTNGVVLGQFVKPGGTTANRVESQTTPDQHTFGVSLSTAASGNNVIIRYCR